MLQWFSLDYDVICISETWNMSNRDIKLKNFQLYETCRAVRGSGTAVYVKSNMQSTRFNNFIHNNSKEYEITSVLVRPNYLPKSVTVLSVVCVYFPPNSNKSIHFKLFKTLCNLVENIRHKYKSPGFLFQGDFNKWKYLCSFLTTTNFTQIVDFPSFIHSKKVVGLILCVQI